MAPYPLLLEPMYKTAVWGGDRLNKLFGRVLPWEKVSESWDISCREDEMCIVENGELAGKTFESALKLMGYDYDHKSFPLLIALIDATMDLSVQVHPGKDESWYVAEAPTNASVIMGLMSGVTRAALEAALRNNNGQEVEQLLNRIPVSKGDFIHIPAGVVHALTAGMIVYEVQQNIDITYRLYDYNRPGADGRPRELHVDQALDIIDFTASHEAASKHYSVEVVTVECELAASSEQSGFHTLTIVEGDCTIETPALTTHANASRSVFIPSDIGDYKIIGSCKLLKSTVR